MRKIRSYFRQLGLGEVAYRYFYRHLSHLRDIQHTGGFSSYYRTRLGEQEMIQFCESVQRQDASLNKPPLKPIFLTGEKYWHQTLLCSLTLQKFSERPVHPTLIDDGSLSDSRITPFRRCFSEVQVIKIEQTEQQLDRVLPRKQYPALRAWRTKHPLLKKLTDVFLAREDGGILLDSDMLFFRKPEFLLDRFDRITRPCCMQDVHTAYGFSRGLLNALASGPIPEKANIGILGLPDHSLNPQELEKWLAHCIAREGRVYNLVQALCALHFSRAGVDVAPKSDYVVIDQSPRDWQPDAALYHFVAKANPLYFQLAWKRALSLP